MQFVFLILLGTPSWVLRKDDHTMTTQTTLPFIAVGGTKPTGGFFVTLRAILQAAASRRELAQMDERMLRDIGVGRSEALAEAERAPWDLTPRRR